MNIISKQAINALGYGFIPNEYLPKGKNEYHLRNIQNRSGIEYKHLTAYEIEVLVRNRNTSDNWNNILVSDAFNPELVKNCKFYGLVRIGKLEPYFLEFNNIKMPVGLYNSTIISCDFGDNVVVDNVNYLSHYIIGNEVFLVNINEMATTDHTKFGNGVLKEGEPESIRIWLEVCNENGGRSIVPFSGMLPGDAYLWSRYRDNKELQARFLEITERQFDKIRGYYGKVGDRSVIKNCSIIKDVWIGTDAYIKGANKLKNLTINSTAEAPTQVGEGCELVNGIINVGCRIFYGVKAVRFVMASHSQLKYGARLINSYLGNNATISCCEVLNSLIFPAHEQHHNNSFLCAALIMGQSNMAAGATIGSNHNSRAADGEIIAGRGFWPGLCVSLKHNSKFASFMLLAKGDYPAELNIPIPFCLVVNEVHLDKIVVMPGYWFKYNMYALARNAGKYIDRDKRIEKLQHIEYDYLAPDTINEIVGALSLFEKFTGKAYYRKFPEGKVSEEKIIAKGKELLLNNDPVVNGLEILAEGFENSSRKVEIIKVAYCYNLFRELISYYVANQLIDWFKQNKKAGIEELSEIIPSRNALSEWVNVGGQLMLETELQKLLQQIISGKIKNWDSVHAFYEKQGILYSQQKLLHAIAAYEAVYGIGFKKNIRELLPAILNRSVETKEWMTKGILDSRAKDYKNPFKKMVYDNDKEMDAVVGSLKDNSFIKQETEALKSYKETIKKLAKVKQVAL
ncbi:DUF4954 family protein [Pinibacter soli]|uniref:DUF4954 family protein n=1 Tax=Pinibacter soli TaxID=3044211 RepID=A0ABT6RG68_9BACT|nr:DUF4954 family protein [Pinibacter soli]MDI3321567.1 DUF4954 family protein [Pinibacter soli]